ncbi:4'-phosphopantetheinyl transferase family protein [Streptomyces sp. NPDC058662]|uniref:4'-phosphopantetheinyl transferase family protein n=1 Tax=Streptomyces sp. NPDC058662 TaxID=3346583 RepID=UPI0036693992
MIEHVNELGAVPPPVEGRSPGNAAVAVWSLDTTLDVVGGLPVSGAAKVLDAEEQERAGRLVRPGDRHRYVASHLGLRVLLGMRLGLAPERVVLVREECRCGRGAHGRPAVAGGGVHFSLSHSGDVAYVSLAGVPVGIDVERLPSAASVADVLTSLHPAEAAELSGLPAADLPAAFARVWARKEACLKATGTGLALGLVEPFVGAAADPAPVPGWDLYDLPAPAGYAAALAVRSRGVPA